MLWVSAGPGCGKSVLAKYLADSVLKNTESRTICYFFFKDDFEDQKSVVSALCCILHQLFKQKPDLLSETILKEFEDHPENFTSSFSNLWDTLLSAAKGNNAGEIVCLLDAIDECEENERSQLAKALCKLYGTRSDFSLKFLLTSRPYGGIRQDFQPLEISSLPIIHLSGESDAEMEKISREIDIFIKARVLDVGARLKLTCEEQGLLLQELMRVPQRTYLWAHLTLDLIKSDINKTGILKATSQLPETVDDAYERILSKSHNFEEAKKLLHIVVAAARPLTLEEMNLALALRENHQSYSDLDLKSEERFCEYVRDLCGLFVTIVDSKIYLLHQTAKQFLVQNNLANLAERNSGNPKWKNSLRPQDSHQVLAKICIWHLLFTEFEDYPLDIDATESQYVEGHAFLDYSAKHWMTHLRESHAKVDNDILRLCDASSKRCLTWFRIYWTSTNIEFPENFTTLMIASYFGLDQVILHLLEDDNLDLNSRDDTYKRSAVFWAAGNGFDLTVELLVGGIGGRWKDKKLPFRAGAQVDCVDGHGQTPLFYAVWNRHLAVIKLLLKAGARTDLIDDSGATALSYAKWRRYDDVLDLFPGKETRPDSKDDIKKAFIIAVQKGFEDVVKQLLETEESNANFTVQNGWTPLSYAIEKKNVAIVQLLLDQKVEVDYRYNVVSKFAACTDCYQTDTTILDCCRVV
ncbi:hypothetical protein TWF706_004558 [Orbilia oligospora]|nr:hypothetical protein TWF103_006647 [Orbilia oligospora]KAF3078197.1 hypothetical protein TWF706_004558 [Orbilia oligospora]